MRVFLNIIGIHYHGLEVTKAMAMECVMTFS